MAPAPYIMARVSAILNTASLSIPVITPSVIRVVISFIFSGPITFSTVPVAEKMMAVMMAGIYFFI